jgi:hypothetical protein
MIPTLDQLLQFFRTHVLPEETHPRYRSIRDDVRACVPEDKLRWEILQYAKDEGYLIFLDTAESAPATTYQNLDDDHYRRLMSGSNGLEYSPEGKDGRPAGKAVLDICRKDDGDGSVFVTDRVVPVLTDETILANNPALPALRQVAFRFTEEEITAVIRGTGMNATHYGVDPYDKTRFLVFPDVGQIDAILVFIQGPSSPIAPDRRGPMAAAFEGTVSDLRFQRKFQDESLSAQKRNDERFAQMQWENRIMQGLLMYLTARQMNLTNAIDSFVSNVLRATVETPGLLIRRDIGSLKRRWGEIFRRKTPITVDVTDKLRAMRVPLTDGARQILEGFDRGEFPHVIFGGPSGAGKGFSVDGAFAAAVQGNSGVEAFEGLNLRAVRISVGAIVQEAGALLNGAEAIFLRSLNVLKDSPTLVQFTEADQLAEAGMTTGNKALNLLPRFYRIMEDEAYKNLYIVLESTRWKTIETAAGDLLRRTAFGEVKPPLPQDVRKALETGIELRRTGKGVSKATQKRFERLAFTPEALDAVTALGSFEVRGAPPSSYLTVLDGVARDVSKKTPAGKASITVQDVIDYVARRTGAKPSEVAGDLKLLLKDGLENNPQIQSRLVASFYRAYPEPYNGFFNPVAPNPEKVVVTRNGEEEALPRGAYATAQEAIRALSSSPSQAPETEIDLTEIRISEASASDLAKAAPRSAYTPKDFEALFKAKYEGVERHLDAANLSRLSEAAFKLWEKDGKPMDVVKGRALPKDVYFEKIIDSLTVRMSPAQKTAASGLAFLEMQKNPARAEALADRLSPETAGVAERLLEMTRKGEVK